MYLHQKLEYHYEHIDSDRQLDLVLQDMRG